MNAHVSPVLARHRAESDMLRTNRARALLLRAEAIADHRADNDVCAIAKLPAIRDLIREAVEVMTGEKFSNPIYPEKN